MNAVTAAHEYHSLGRSKHVFAANGAIAIHRAFDTFVRVSNIHADADVADFAVKEVFANTLADTTDAAVVAVVD